MSKIYHLVFRASDKAEFETVVDGTKTVETRAATPKYRQVQVGDRLVISCGVEVVEKTVKSVVLYSSIDELLESEGLAKVMPLAENVDQAKAAWCSYPGYKEKIARYGLIAFYI